MRVSPYIAVSQIPDANRDLLKKLYDTLPENIKVLSMVKF